MFLKETKLVTEIKYKDRSSHTPTLNQKNYSSNTQEVIENV
jgi:hypothetical protein